MIKLRMRFHYKRLAVSAKNLVVKRGIGARIGSGLGPHCKGLQPVKQSAAIFSGIPVLRGDFGGGGGRVRQELICRKRSDL